MEKKMEAANKGWRVRRGVLQISIDGEVRMV